MSFRTTRHYVLSFRTTRHYAMSVRTTRHYAMSFRTTRSYSHVILNGTKWSEESKRVCQTVRVAGTSVTREDDKKGKKGAGGQLPARPYLLVRDRVLSRLVVHRRRSRHRRRFLRDVRHERLGRQHHRGN